LSSHYRSVINYSPDSLEQAKSNFKRIKDFVLNLRKIYSGDSTRYVLNLENIAISNFREKFETALDDDLNTPLALAALYDFITETNKLLAENGISDELAKDILMFWEKINKSFRIRDKDR